MSLFIKGVGIITEQIQNYATLQTKPIDSFELLAPKADPNDYLAQRWGFQSKSLIAREDRSLLNKMAQLAIDTSAQAMQMAQTKRAYTKAEKQCFPIFCATETVDYGLSSLNQLLEQYDNDQLNAIHALGEVKQYLNPLDMLRLLSTNPLYHLSKVFNLNGGGYPTKKMSLSSLIALELASFYLTDHLSSHGLVTSVGQIGVEGNLTAFMKMGLLKTSDTAHGIIPAYGAASMVVSKDKDFGCSLGEILSVNSLHHAQHTVSQADWSNLYSCIGTIKEPLSVVYYNNGVQALFEAEQQAVAEHFPQAKTYSYKPYIGYTGKANNLIDLIIALSDRQIPSNSLVLINGIGTGVGLGCILLRKY